MFKGWNFLDRIKGDKVVWIITLMLFALSILCIFSSSTSLVTKSQTRLDIVSDQIKYVLVGLGIVILIYNIRSIRLFSWFSQWGFLLSFALLLLLFLCRKFGQIGPFEAEQRNGAVRALVVAGKQVYVYEVVKVAMVMYMARMVESLKNDNFPVWNAIARSVRFLSNPWVKRTVFVYIPFAIVTVMVLDGSNTSGIFIAGVMAVTLAVGTGDKRDAISLSGIAVAGAVFCLATYFISGGTRFTRIGTIFSDTRNMSYWEKVAKRSDPRTVEFSNAIDNIRQPYSAKIAVKQGFPFGKGPGQSTQRYVVPDMCSDYMYSFIIEEYGIFGALLVIIIFVSLLARGAIIIQYCGENETFAKVATMGLVLLISGQAFLHIMVNAGIGPITGQTLPILSNGTGAMLCFSVALGVILSISRLAKENVEKEEQSIERDINVQGTEGDN